MDNKKQLQRMMVMNMLLGFITVAFALLWVKVYYNQVQVMDRLDRLVEEVMQQRKLNVSTKPPLDAGKEVIRK